PRRHGPWWGSRRRRGIDGQKTLRSSDVPDVRRAGRLSHHGRSSRRRAWNFWALLRQASRRIVGHRPVLVLVRRVPAADPDRGAARTSWCAVSAPFARPSPPPANVVADKRKPSKLMKNILTSAADPILALACAPPAPHPLVFSNPPKGLARRRK